MSYSLLVENAPFIKYIANPNEAIAPTE